MHIPVLLKETIDGLEIKSGNIVVDATLGGGGHSREIVERFGESIQLVAIDEDEEAIIRTKEFLNNSNIQLVQGNFRDIDKILENIGLEKIDKIIADLGISSFQLDDGKRGFTFMKDEPLMMTMKKNPSGDDITAENIVNDWGEETIADIIYAYGDERYSRRIAKAIIEARKIKRITNSLELAEIIKNSVPTIYRYGKINPATRTFQAIRIAVNGELEALKSILIKGIPVLRSEGRIAIISFHSLEDKIVKNFFKEQEDRGVGKRITKKPITPTQEEIKMNPRSRSAKLRIFEKK